MRYCKDVQVQERSSTLPNDIFVPKCYAQMRSCCTCPEGFERKTSQWADQERWASSQEALDLDMKDLLLEGRTSMVGRIPSLTETTRGKTICFAL
jgi:hypothetical protein